MTNAYTCRDAAGIRVATVGQSTAPREVLLFMGMLGCVGPAEIRRCALLADEWDARVTIADVPGCGHGYSRLTLADRSELRRGYFASVARRMVRSAKEVNPKLVRCRANVVGYSLGASIAAAAAADAGLLRVGELTLIEPVAVEKWNPLFLLRSIVLEDRAAASVEKDCAYRQADPLRVDLALLGYALSRGRLTTDLLQANDLHHATTQVVRGSDSKVCRGDAVDHAMRFWQRKSVEVGYLTVPGRHGLWHNEADVTSLARGVSARWPDTPRLSSA